MASKGIFRTEEQYGIFLKATEQIADNGSTSILCPRCKKQIFCDESIKGHRCKTDGCLKLCMLYWYNSVKNTRKRQQILCFCGIIKI